MRHSNPNVFLRADVTFSVGDHTLHFDNKNISSYGVFGMPWPPLSPTKNFGQRVEVQLRLPHLRNIRLHTIATLVREVTSTGEYLGLRLELDSDTDKELRRLIEVHGYCPKEFLRKFPRVPSTEVIQSFPLQMLGTPLASGDSSVPLAAPMDAKKNRGPSQRIMIFDVRNVSLGGVMVSSENALGWSIQPKQEFHLAFEPRGPFKDRIEARAVVLRILEEPDPTTGNLMRQFGFRYLEMSESDRASYLELLKQILNKVRVIGPREGA